MNNLSAQAIQETIKRLSEPKVKYRVELASTTEVAKDIIDSLPGVKQLKETGPEAEEAFLALLQDERTLKDDNLAAISVHILESYPSERVKLALADGISKHRFRGISSQLAAETFLKAAGIQSPTRDAIAVALTEAIKIQQSNPEAAQIGRKHDAEESVTRENR